jgi:hypothetical protein
MLLKGIVRIAFSSLFDTFSRTQLQQQQLEQQIQVGTYTLVSLFVTPSAESSRFTTPLRALSS